MFRQPGSKGFVPGLGLLIGVVLGVAAALGGQPGLGVACVTIMAGYAAVLLVFGGRSDTMSVLGGRPADERLQSFDLRASAAAGIVAIVVALVGFIWEVAHGRDGLQFSIVDAAAGVAYLVSLGWLRWRG